MKFHFSHIGPITEAELELGDLTIIAGRNNTGKTYMVYALYGFLKSLKGLYVADLLQNSGLNNMKELISTQIGDIVEMHKRLLEDGQYQLPVSPDELNQDRQKLISKAEHTFSGKLLADIFSSTPDSFEKSSIKIDIDTNVSKNLTLEEENISIEYDGENLIFSIKHPEKADPFFRVNGLNIFTSYVQFLLGEQFPTPFILSAERFGISLFYKELDFTKNRLVEALQNMESDEKRSRISPFDFIGGYASRYALPIKDNIDYTRDIPELARQQGEKYSEGTGTTM